MNRRLRDADQALIGRIAEAIGSGAVRLPEPRYLEEPRGRFEGRAAAVALPATTEEVARVVRLCAEARVGIIPYSGGTGLVGGQIATEGPLSVLVSFERMTRIREVSRMNGVIVAEAGCILADVQNAARAAGRLFPLSLASEGSARIGGLLGTNAGGVAVLRYGNARDLCLGVEAVMADGSIVHGLSPLVKDNMGYDLRHLLIGAEGTLGLITAASLRLVAEPSLQATAWICVASLEQSLALFERMQDAFGGAISAFEVMHVRGLEFLAEAMPDIALPPDGPGCWRLLVEVGDAVESRVDERLEAVLAEAAADGTITEALISQNGAQRAQFWKVRESIPLANRRIGAISSHDISIPRSRLVAFVERAGTEMMAIDPTIRVNCFGHLGDGNLHYNVFPPRGQSRAAFEPVRGKVKDTVHALVNDLGGSVGAEHGVGRLKVSDLERFGDPVKVSAMRAIKRALDPDGILNPGAVLRLA